VPTDEVVIVDPDALEFGVTELLPVMPKPRWTPELSRAVSPETAGDQVAGEIDLRDHKRR
jgi:hypothetical protein